MELFSLEILVFYNIEFNYDIDTSIMMGKTFLAISSSPLSGQEERIVLEIKIQPFGASEPKVKKQI